MIKRFGFLKEEDCDNYIDAQAGVMGRRSKWSATEYGDWESREFIIYENEHEMKKGNIEKIKKNALSKLTNEEKIVLGLA